jgi:hypothetical protein
MAEELERMRLQAALDAQLAAEWKETSEGYRLGLEVTKTRVKRLELEMEM